MTVDTRIRMSHVSIGDRERQLVAEVLDSGRVAQGPKVEAFENAISSIVGTEHAIAVSSGTAALVVALQAAGIGPGHEVVLPALTFGATLNAVLAVGAVARIADVGATFTVEAQDIVPLLSDATAALLPVHLYGLPADLPSIAGLAARSGLALVEDAAQALSAEVEGRQVGSWGIGCFSFYATKNVMAGEGGAVTTDDDRVADVARRLRNQGMRARYEYTMPGLNWRMSDLHAAIGIGQLERLQEVDRDRSSNARTLTEGLRGIEWLATPEIPPSRTHVFHQYTITLSDDAPLGRDDLAERLDRAGIESSIVYPEPVHAPECFRHHPRVRQDPTPNAARLSQSVLSIPVHPGLRTVDIERIVATIATAGERA